MIENKTQKYTGFYESLLFKVTLIHEKVNFHSSCSVYKIMHIVVYYWVCDHVVLVAYTENIDFLPIILKLVRVTSRCEYCTNIVHFCM